MQWINPKYAAVVRDLRAAASQDAEPDTAPVRGFIYTPADDSRD
jgi:hypothetical protein